MPGPLTIALTGDIILDVENPDDWISGIAAALHAADLVIGHLEVPHTNRGIEQAADIPAPAAPPENLDALARAGVTVVSLAGNHIADRGPEGIADTIDRLDALGIAHAGAGMTLEEARRPAIVERHGRRLALISYNCVGPEASWATASSAGSNYLKMRTANGRPVTPREPLGAPEPEALDQLAEDIRSARGRADLVVVALHKGIVHTPSVIAPYERQLARAAITAGADIVVGHHAHILRGIEILDGRPVFHGLGNGCVVTRALSPDQTHPARAAWALQRRELFGFEPDPAYPLAPFHPEAVNGAVGVVVAHQSGRLETGVIPVFVEPPGRPVSVTDDRAAAVIDYLDRIGNTAGLERHRWAQRSDRLWMCA